MRRFSSPANAALIRWSNPATRWYARERRRDDPDYPDDIPLLFDVNTEATIPTWFSACLLLAVAGVSVLLVVVTRAAGESGERRWALLAVVFTAMSLDETVALHERLGSVVTDAGVRGPVRSRIPGWLPDCCSAWPWRSRWRG